MNVTTEIIKVENCYFSYEDGTKAVNGMNFSIQQGEKIAFLGANGSGKSTIFLCLNGILKPQKGKIYFEGAPIDYSRKGLLNLRSQVGIVFQEPDNQLFSASVYQEISFGILNLGVEEDKAKEEVEAVIEELEITGFRHKPTHCLSGGQKKQVSIADILVMKPKVILLDEPVSALDPKHTKMVQERIDSFSEKGITVIVSTHDMNYALSWADRVIIFKDGQVTTDEKPEIVFQDKELMERTNLQLPDVVQLYQSLCRQGILQKRKRIPKTMKELEQYILEERRKEA